MLVLPLDKIRTVQILLFLSFQRIPKQGYELPLHGLHVEIEILPGLKCTHVWGATLQLIWTSQEHYLVT